MAILVNGEHIDDEVVKQEAALLRPRYEEVMGEMDPVAREIQLHEWSKENVIERVLLRQEGWKDPEPVPTEVIEEELERIRPEVADSCEGGPSREQFDEAAACKEIEARLRVERLVRRISGKVAPPKNKDVTEYYKKNKERFWLEDMVRAAHVVKNLSEGADESEAQKVMEAALAEIEAGADFHEVANKYSDCGGNGGDLGYFPRGEMVDEFEKIAFALPIGGRSGIFRSVFGLHIAKVVDKREAGPVPLNEVKNEIEATLLREKQERAMEHYLDKLLAGAKVETVKAEAAKSDGAA